MKYILSNQKQDLVEIGQENPIRFMLLTHQDKHTFVNTTDPFKCKDYFNDFTTYRHFGRRFGIYGMRSEQAKFDNDGGLHVFIANISPFFVDNATRLVEGELGPLWGIFFKFFS